MHARFVHFTKYGNRLASKLAYGHCYLRVPDKSLKFTEDFGLESLGG